jgi:Rad3-related DNA helicase
VTAEVLHTITKPNEEFGASFLLSPTNILSDQYFSTFMSGRDPWDNLFRVVKGAAAYECPALTTDAKVVTAEDCTIRIFRKTGKQSIIDQYCETCEYNQQKAKREFSRHMITNYAVFLIDRLFIDLLKSRTLTVFDEGHLLNDLFTNFATLEYTTKSLEQFCEDIIEVLGPSGIDMVNEVRMVIQLMQREQGINTGNYMIILDSFQEFFEQVSNAAGKKAEQTNDSARYIKLKRIASKYANELMKILCLNEYKYDHSFEFSLPDQYKKEKNSVFSIKPIFIGKLFSMLEHSNYNLICSATISEEYARTTMTLENATYIRLPPVFPKENKKVVFYKAQNLNFTTLQSAEVKQKLLSACKDICKFHFDKNERGIILTPSFVLNEEIANYLIAEFPRANFIVHKKGNKMENIIEQFKFTDGACVMITPSGYEGMDLSGDLSRFQVLVKAPFASLGEARMKHIATHYSQIYSIITLMKLVQGAGRSIRGPDDWAVTYMLDSNIHRLWSSKQMAWADEFSSSSKLILG